MHPEAREGCFHGSQNLNTGTGHTRGRTRNGRHTRHRTQRTHRQRTQDTQIKSQWFSMFQPQARKLTKTSFRCIFCCHTKVFGVSLACVSMWSMKAPIGKKYSVLAVCTLRATDLSAAIFRWQRPLRCRGPREKKPRSRHGWLATPTPTRTTTPANTTPAATMHTVRGLALSRKFTSCKQLQHFYVVQRPIIQRLCTWAVHVWGCAWGLCVS